MVSAIPGFPAFLSKLWEVWSYGSRDTEGQGVIRRVQDVASTFVLHPCIGTRVVLEFQSVGVPVLQNSFISC